MLRASQALIRHRFCPYWASWLINFEQSVLVCINEKTPYRTMSRSELDEICLLVDSRLAHLSS